MSGKKGVLPSFFSIYPLFTLISLLSSPFLAFQCDGSNGACWEYDSWSLARDVFICSFVLKSLSSIAVVLAWHNYHPASAEEDAPEAVVKAKEEGVDDAGEGGMGEGDRLQMVALEAGDATDGATMGNVESDS